MLNKKKFIENKHFLKWFENSKVKNDNDEPIIVYHGTTHDFNTFSKSNEQNYFGSGYYFTDNYNDANLNYLSDGDDITRRIEEEADILSDYHFDDPNSFFDYYSQFFINMNEYILDNLEELKDIHLKIDFNQDNLIKYLNQENIVFDDNMLNDITNIQDIFYKIASSKFKGDHQGAIMPCYLSIKNPVYYFKNNKQYKFYSELTLGNEKETLLKHLDLFFKKLEININTDNFFEEIKNDLIFYLKENETINNFELKEILLNNYQIYDLLNEHKEKINIIFPDIFDDCYEIKIEKNGTFEKICDSFIQISQDLDIEEHVSEFLNTFEEQILEYGYVNQYDFLKKLRENEKFIDIDYNIEEFIKDIIINAGFDGVIMDTNDFGFKNIDKNTVHYISYNSNNVKSAIGNCGEFSLDNNNIVARINDDDYFTDKKSKKYFEKHINKITKHWKNKPNIVILDNQECSDIKNIENLSDRTQAVYDKLNDTVFIFKDKIKNKIELEKVLIHEIIGHYGLKKVHKENYFELLDKVYLKFNKHHSFQKIKNKYFHLKNKKNYKHILAEEFIAFESEKSLSIIFKIKQIFNEFLSKIGFNNLSQDTFFLQNIIKKQKDYILNSSNIKKRGIYYEKRKQ